MKRILDKFFIAIIGVLSLVSTHVHAQSAPSNMYALIGRYDNIPPNGGSLCSKGFGGKLVEGTHSGYAVSYCSREDGDWLLLEVQKGWQNFERTQPQFLILDVLHVPKANKNQQLVFSNCAIHGRPDENVFTLVNGYKHDK